MAKSIRLALFGLFMCQFFQVFGQHTNSSQFGDYLANRYGRNWLTASQVPIPLFSVSSNPAPQAIKNTALKENRGLILDVDIRSAKNIIENAPASISLNLPTENGFAYAIRLVKVNAYNFEVLNAKGEAAELHDKSVHYQGQIVGKNNSLVAISFQEDLTVSGLIADGKSNLVLGKIKESQAHVLYEEHDFKSRIPFSCFTEANEEKVKAENIDWNKIASSNTSVTCKPIGVYFELDYDMYTRKGSTIEKTVAYLTAVFNQVNALYNADGMDMYISAVKVWDQKDPYSGILNTEELVNTFQSNTKSNFTGHIAHFLSGRISDLGGGIAYAIPSEICTKSQMFCASAIYDYYAELPTYSWTVNVIAHEMGHILGSRHTHWCGWKDGPIDGCSGFAESDSSGNNCTTGPIPPKGGTIMSYCHRSSVGINPSLGFGPQPKAILLYKLGKASCISSTSTTAAPSNLQVVQIANGNVKLKWNAVADAQYYIVEIKRNSENIWKYAGSSLTNEITLANISFSTHYNVRVSTNCSDFSSAQEFTTPQSFLKISPLLSSTFCRNMFFSFQFEAINFISGNTFRVELSDKNGSFANPQTIGFLNSDTSGVITVQFEEELEIGNGYRMRLRGSAPFTVSEPTEPFSISGKSPVSFLSFDAKNPSDNSFRIWASANQPAKVYYVVDFGTADTPTAEQIIDGKNANGSSGIKYGNFRLDSAQTQYHKIIADLWADFEYLIFMTLDNGTDCPKPITANYVRTTGTSILPTYCTPKLNCSDDDYIDFFEIPEIKLSNISSGCPANKNAYRDHISNLYEMQPGKSYPFSLKAGPLYNEYPFIWIDFDRSNTFDSSELVFTSTTKAKTFSSTINVPASAKTGLTKMRVKVNYSNETSNDPCQNGNNYGEAEDFLILIGSNLPCPSLKHLVSTDHDVTNGIGKIYRGEKIEATNDITTTSAADYFAKKSITLSPGFSATAGTIFQAQILENCGTDK